MNQDDDLGHALAAFLDDHRACGTLATGFTGAPERVWLTCSCGAPDGFAAWRQAVARGFEGYVAKDAASTYEGGATRRWLKVKQKNWTIGEDRWRRWISVARLRCFRLVKRWWVRSDRTAIHADRAIRPAQDSAQCRADRKRGKETAGRG